MGLFWPLLFCAFLAACGGVGKRGGELASATFDLGPPTVLPEQPALPGLALGVRVAPGLDGNAIRYRLAYAGGGLVREYALAHWVAPVSGLLERRLSQILATPGVHQGSGMPCVLWVELDEFAQVFTAPQQSYGKLSARVSILGRQGLLASHAFALETPSMTPDSRGGVEALSLATTRLAEEIKRWHADSAGAVGRLCRGN